MDNTPLLVLHQDTRTRNGGHRTMVITDGGRTVANGAGDEHALAIYRQREALEVALFPTGYEWPEYDAAIQAEADGPDLTSGDLHDDPESEGGLT